MYKMEGHSESVYLETW